MKNQGTLSPICTDPELAKPSDELLEVLTKLASNSHNIVWIISGRSQVI